MDRLSEIDKIICLHPKVGRLFARGQHKIGGNTETLWLIFCQMPAIRQAFENTLSFANLARLLSIYCALSEPLACCRPLERNLSAASSSGGSGRHKEVANNSCRPSESSDMSTQDAPDKRKLPGWIHRHYLVVLVHCCSCARPVLINGDEIRDTRHAHRLTAEQTSWLAQF